MRREPELLVPLSEAREARQPEPELRLPRWAVILTRIWIVLALFVAWMTLTSGDRALHWREAAYTLAGFVFTWYVVFWIFGPTLPPNDEQR